MHSRHSVVHSLHVHSAYELHVHLSARLKSFVANSIYIFQTHLLISIVF